MPLPGDYNFPQPSDLGVIGWAYPPVCASGPSIATTAGVVYLTKVRLAPGLNTITNILASVQTAGVTLTAGQCFAGIYDPGWNLLGQTADQSGVWTSVGVKTMPLSPAPIVVDGTRVPYVWVAFLSNGTTPPAFNRGFSGSNFFPNLNAPLGQGQFASDTTTGRTALGAALGGLTQTANILTTWAGLS